MRERLEARPNVLGDRDRPGPVDGKGGSAHAFVPREGPWPGRWWPVSAPAGLPVQDRAGRSHDGAAGRPAPGPRRAVLGLRRIHPWSVFKVALLTSLVLASVAIAIAAAAALYSGLGALGVPQTVNNLFAPVGGGSPVLTFSGFLGAAALLAALGRCCSQPWPRWRRRSTTCAPP